MSTAVGHGLADPKTRGKPVSHANEGRRLLFLGLLRVLLSSGAFDRLREGGKTHAVPVPKGIPVKIPEPEGWTECNSHRSLAAVGLWRATAEA